MGGGAHLKRESVYQTNVIVLYNYRNALYWNVCYKRSLYSIQITFLISFTSSYASAGLSKGGIKSPSCIELAAVAYLGRPTRLQCMLANTSSSGRLYPITKTPMAITGIARLDVETVLYDCFM